MGKKLKLSLDDLKITSFVTSIKEIKGGLYPTNTCNPPPGEIPTGPPDKSQPGGNCSLFC
ncbi:pinensin family lanthipeptide [bacterium]|nr:pinensin family lanthipeptide [bacterium]